MTIFNIFLDIIKKSIADKKNVSKHHEKLQSPRLNCGIVSKITCNTSIVTTYKLLHSYCLSVYVLYNKNQQVGVVRL